VRAIGVQLRAVTNITRQDALSQKPEAMSRIYAIFETPLGNSPESVSCWSFNKIVILDLNSKMRGSGTNARVIAVRASSFRLHEGQ
jgi:hypothetical protein